MKVIDSFMFGLEYELDILEWRLEYLYKYVSNFVLVEAFFDQLGNPKPAYFLEHKERYKKYNDKIVHVVLKEPVTKIRGSWGNENFQRNSIVKGLEKIAPASSDLIVISDLDEFPNVDAIKYYVEHQIQSPVSLTQDMMYYFLNLKANYTWRGSQLCRSSIFRDGITPQRVRDLRERMPTLPVHGGWHFSYLGGVDAVLRKINSVCESDSHSLFNNRQTILDFICRKVLHFNGAPLQHIDLKDFSVGLLPNSLSARLGELVEKGYWLE